VPSLELLLAQPADRRKAIIGNAPVKIAIEAAVRWAGRRDRTRCDFWHARFRASARRRDLFKHSELR